MNRLTVSIVIFFLALLAPLGYLVFRTYQGVAREEVAQFHFFGQALFDQMDEALLEFIRTEEDRGIDAYASAEFRPYLADRVKMLPYILGYYQIDPEGRIEVPYASETKLPEGLKDVAARLRRQIRSREQALTQVRQELEQLRLDEEQRQKQEQKNTALSQRYFDSAKLKKEMRKAPAAAGSLQSVDQGRAERFMAMEKLLAEPAESAPSPAGALRQGGRVEVGPLEAVFISNTHVFLFRRVFPADTLFHQGLVVNVPEMLTALSGRYFAGHPIAGFARLTLEYGNESGAAGSVHAGAKTHDPRITLNHLFPRPLSFIRARIACDAVPEMTSRTTLTFMVAILCIVVVLGLLAIYSGARGLMELSRRRAGFVSSVTHELKTPLTNIRMYIEMLQQGMAATPEKEARYLDVIASESARLTGLINNVLAFSKLESKKRRMDIQPGNVGDTVSEVAGITGERLRREGFTLHVDVAEGTTALFDREALVQVLVNLLENSMKFGATAPVRELRIRAGESDGRVRISVSDTGPGIPERDLKRVFEDFYRVEDGLTRKTKGAGIGLAIVRKLVLAMGGKIRARNNEGPGCEMEIFLDKG